MRIRPARVCVFVLLALAGCGGGEAWEPDLILFPDQDLRGEPDAAARDSVADRGPGDDPYAPSDRVVPDATVPDATVPDTPVEEVVQPPPEGPCNTFQALESVADLKGSYSSGNWKNTLLTLLDRRYDPGYYILTHVQDQSQLPYFVQTGNWENFVLSASTAVHEMNHLYGWELGAWSQYGYFLCEKKTIKVPPVQTPPRSVVYALIPASVMPWVKQYADIYLTGDMGQQDLLTLLDELNAYTHSLYCDYQLTDQFPWGIAISSRDGLATFMLFSELYLKYVRANNAGAYGTIKNNFASLILDLFDRANAGIDQSEVKKNQLSLHAEAILDQVYDPDLYAEVELLAQ